MNYQKNEIYKCDKCGLIVDTVRGAEGHLVCCGLDMRLLKEGEIDAATEKHVPVIEKVDGGVKVTVGSVNHPMEEDHFIEWIEIILDGKVFRQFLKADDKPEVFFKIDGDNITARAYCNLHGLWKA
ncbi:MAG: desulfoferrodoxin [candidate division Zixibacteria bacterium]|nr:desulfoferrodoxin [candidate division Zixibacteria bacterium]